MNTKLVKLGAIPLSLFLVILAARDIAHAQSLDVPPIKMGLWQTETKTASSGTENTPMAGRGQRTTVSEGCLTPDTWKSAMESMGKCRAGSDDCKVTNLTRTADR